MVSIEPSIYIEASKSSKWVKAMDAEIEMIEKNGIWDLVPKPYDKNVSYVKWVFRVKFNSNGSINKYKMRLVVTGYVQFLIINYGDTFASVAHMNIICLIIAIIAQFD